MGPPNRLNTPDTGARELDRHVYQQRSIYTCGNRHAVSGSTVPCELQFFGAYTICNSKPLQKAFNNSHR